MRLFNPLDLVKIEIDLIGYETNCDNLVVDGDPSFVDLVVTILVFVKPVCKCIRFINVLEDLTRIGDVIHRVVDMYRMIVHSPPLELFSR